MQTYDIDNLRSSSELWRSTVAKLCVTLDGKKILKQDGKEIEESEQLAKVLMPWLHLGFMVHIPQNFNDNYKKCVT